METNQKRLKMQFGTILYLLLTCLVFGCDSKTQAQDRQQSQVQTQDEPTGSSKKKCIKLAILLDTSNSMDGLIDQAKSQLWSIVNELARAECDATKPELKIALYEYGNDNLPQAEGFIRMVTELTTDLDQISADLFSLRTNGGDEYCGQVIGKALKQLSWSKASGDYQVIFIAGNEPFTQGSIDFREACSNAKEKGVIVNTIFCGNFDEGINTSWKKGADLTGGKYFSIEQNRKTVYIETPYDRQISELNNKLNDTYVYYGKQGVEKKMLQKQQDENAAQYGSGNAVNRAVSKSSHVYKNSSWDIVDATEDKSIDLASVKSEDLPEEMQKMTTNERQEYIEQKKTEREAVQKEIASLNVKRTEYISQHNQSKEGMLDNAMLAAIRNQATERNFTFAE